MSPPCSPGRQTTHARTRAPTTTTAVATREHTHWHARQADVVFKTAVLASTGKSLTPTNKTSFTFDLGITADVVVLR